MVYIFISSGGYQNAPVVHMGRISKSQRAARGRVREVTNGSFGAAKLVESLGT